LGGRTVNYTYDDLYRLTSESIASDPHGVNGTATYSYDPAGNRLNRSSSIAPVPSQISTYDPNDRLTSDTYDNNGNTTAANGNSYSYDFENYLTRLNSGSVTYVYDGDGNRVAKTVGGVTTNYLVDTNNPTGYAQVVDELQGGVVIEQFTYGHDLISRHCPVTSAYPLSFYGYDGHGSVRLLTNAGGAITDAYDYDAFGNLIYRSGTTPNDYLYSGEQLDPNLGFYYLRARYMDPSSGRFLSMDGYEGNVFDPGSLHKYLYGRNQPVDRIDPSGHLSALAIAGIIVGAIIVAMAIAYFLPLLSRRSQPGSEPPIHIQDQPVLIDGSGWDEGIVQYHESAAARLWALQANIIVEPLPTIRLKGCESRTSNCPLNTSEGTPTSQGVGNFLNAAGIYVKHASVFVNQINEANDWGGLDPDGGAYVLVAAFSSTYPAGYALAHEWGHSFNLEHVSIFRRNLMNPAEDIFLFRGDFITDDQRRTARAAAAKYQ
jgi:RHS repeat-associated protein